MTEDDKTLVERLRDDWPEILVEKHWMMDSDAIDKQREEAADRIEALEAKVERLREAMRDAITEIETGAPLTGSDILSAALGEK